MPKPLEKPVHDAASLHDASEDISALALRLEQFRRILIWGEMGIGKSSLALELLPALNRRGVPTQILELDPGSPPFGVPGAVCRGWWQDDRLLWGDCEALCSLDAARFRLPLLLAARRLLERVQSLPQRQSILIDPPGVVRGVAGAELLVGMVQTLGIEAIVILSRQKSAPPLAAELDALSIERIIFPPSPEARLAARNIRVKQRRRMWDDFLEESIVESTSLDRLPVQGTAPPVDVPDAWSGRQAALIDDTGRTLRMGEVVSLTGSVLEIRLAPGATGAAAALLIRDAGRDADGSLATMRRPAGNRAAGRLPAELHLPLSLAPGVSEPVTSHCGPAWATLVGGVFGDPLLHVRLRYRKTSLLFDIGDPARLPAKVAHQVCCIFLSHAHLDHICGFLWFLRSRMGPFGVCRIFGPLETIRRLEGFLAAITWDRIDENGPVFEVGEFDGTSLRRARLQAGKAPRKLPATPIGDGVLFCQNDLKVRAAICDHHTPSMVYSLEFEREIRVRKDRLAAAGLPPGPWLGELKQRLVDGLGDRKIPLPDGTSRRTEELQRELLLVRPGKKLVYATDLADTRDNRRTVTELARSAHTLFCETAFVDADRDKARATQHLTTLAALEIARDAGVQRLVPFHFSKRYERDPQRVYEELRAAAGSVQIIG